jgi:hypothetical protein
VTVALLASLTFAASANAEVRTGDATDTTGDSIGGPGADLVSAHASYDTTGTVSVSATTQGPPNGAFAFQVATTSGISCLGETATLTGVVPGSVFRTTLTGSAPTSNGVPIVSGNSVTFTAFGPAFANKGWTCMTVTIADPADPSTLWDSLTTPAYFGGHAPDSDGDGVPDSTDKCPGTAGKGTATGCPAPAPAPKTTAKKKATKTPAKCKKLKGAKRTACIKQAQKKY